LKISEDRRRIELDASLVLILLLLWRESSNPYTERLSANSAPVVPIFHTILSLLSPIPKATGVNETPNSLTNPLWSSAEGVFGYVGSWFGLSTASESTSQTTSGTNAIQGAEVLDLKWCNSTAALILIYFLCYLNPSLKSTQVINVILLISRPVLTVIEIVRGRLSDRLCCECPILLILVVVGIQKYRSALF
jgi:hypothetical protein